MSSMVPLATNRFSFSRGGYLDFCRSLLASRRAHADNSEQYFVGLRSSMRALRRVYAHLVLDVPRGGSQISVGRGVGCLHLACIRPRTPPTRTENRDRKPLKREKATIRRKNIVMDALKKMSDTNSRHDSEEPRDRYSLPCDRESDYYLDD